MDSALEYMNRSRIRNVAAGWTPCRVMRYMLASAMVPKSCALNTGEGVARTARCARNISPPTERNVRRAVFVGAVQVQQAAEMSPQVRGRHRDAVVVHVQGYDST
jgi:hypothetical protein